MSEYPKLTPEQIKQRVSEGILNWRLNCFDVTHEAAGLVILLGGRVWLADGCYHAEFRGEEVRRDIPLHHFFRLADGSIIAQQYVRERCELGDGYFFRLVIVDVSPREEATSE